MKRLIVGMLVIFALLIPITHIEANDSSIYCGLSFGLAQYTGEPFNGDGFVPGQKFKDNTKVFMPFIGYKINKYLSFELRYVDFGKARKQYTLDPNVMTLVAPDDTVTIRSYGFTISPFFEYPISDSLFVLGVLGFSYLYVDREVSGGFAPGTSTLGYDSSDTKKDIFYGLGFKYRIIKNLKIRFQWEHYDIDITKINLAVMTVEYWF